MSDDIRADVAAAFAAAGGDNGEAEAAAPTVETGGGGGDAGAVGVLQSEGSGASDAGGVESAGGVDGEAPVADGRTRDGKGRFAPAKPGEKAAAPAPVAAKAPTVTVKPTGAQSVTSGTPAPVAPVATETVRPPQSWKPAAREAFSKAAPELQAEVIRREKEISQALQETAPLKRFQQDFQAAVGPYEAQIRAEGGEPLSAIRELLQTSQVLRTAPPGHKAQLVARIVKEFGVPIDALDAALAGQPAPQWQPQQQGEYRDPRVDQLFGTLQQAHQQRQQAAAAKVQSEITAFAEKAEYFEDVRPAMAALMRGGVATTLQQAYDRACWASDDVRPLLQQKQAREAANAANASTQQARRAATSIRTQPAAARSQAPGGSLEDDVAAAYAALSGR